MKTYVDSRAMPLVGGVLRVTSGSQSDLFVASVVDGIETLTIRNDQQVKEAGWELMTYRNVNPLIKSKPLPLGLPLSPTMR